MISVCIATYNGERFIREQLDSIICQLSPDDEIIISDDGSTDRTVEWASAAPFANIRLVLNHGKHGYTPNFENALKAAQGDIVFLSDQDDIWERDKVEKCLGLLRDADMVISDAVIVDENNREIFGSFFLQRKTRHGLLANLLRFSYLGCCMAMRREVIDRALPFPSDSQLCTHDNWLYLVGAAFYQPKVTTDRLVRYRRHGQNASTGGVAVKRKSRFFQIKYRLYLLGHLFRLLFSRNRYHQK